MATLPPSPGASPKAVERAVNALLKWQATKSKTQKPPLLEHDEFVYLILTLKKIPQKGSVSRTNPFKISLPNPLINPQNDNSELCLIIDDRPKSGLTKDAAKKKIQSENIPISKIIKLSKLKTDYRPFEAKRKLCDSYDVFFADKRVIPLLPKMLGKQFFKKKKIPVAVDLKHKNWKEQIENACGSGLLFLRSGTCSVVKVGRISMGKEELVKNVVAAIDGIADIVPRKWGGIRSFHLKLLESLALPVYQALSDFKLKIEGAKNNEEEIMVEEEKFKDGNAEKKKKKGRIHEIRYMDNSVDEDDDGEIVGDEILMSDGEEGGFGDDSDEKEEEKVITGSGGLDGKKRKKGDEGKSEKKKKMMKGDKGKSEKKKKMMKETKLKEENGIREKKKAEKTKGGDSIKKKNKKVT